MPDKDGDDDTLAGGVTEADVVRDKDEVGLGPPHVPVAASNVKPAAHPVQAPVVGLHVVHPPSNGQVLHEATAPVAVLNVPAGHWTPVRDPDPAGQ